MSTLQELLYTPLDNAFPNIVKFPNRMLAVPNDDKWIEVIHQPNGVARSLLGDANKDPDQGLMRVGVHWPVDAGDDDPSALCLQIQVLYAKGTRFQAAGLTVEIYEKPSIGGAIEDGQTVLFPVSIRYRVFY
jgi:hypothetical protein